MGEMGGINLYGFVSNDPVNKIDLWGLADTGEYGPIVNAIGHFLDNYSNMRDANTIGADKYFHCMANCQAAKEGPVGKEIAEIISECREQIDEKVKGDSRSDCDADRKANDCGRQPNNGTPCSQTCASFRPNGLNPKY